MRKLWLLLAGCVVLMGCQGGDPTDVKLKKSAAASRTEKAMNEAE